MSGIPNKEAVKLFAKANDELKAELDAVKHDLGMHQDALRIAVNMLKTVSGLCSAEISVCRRGIKDLTNEQNQITRKLGMIQALVEPEKDGD